VEVDEGRLLVDTPTELRLQLLATGIDRIDAVWFTHLHADHIHGIDDLRVFTVRRGDLAGYVSDEHRAALTRYFGYVFDPDYQPAEGSSSPRVRLHGFRASEGVRILGREFLPLRVPHGHGHVYGFRVGGLGYITDAKELPPDTLAALRGVEVLVLNALWFGQPHPSHFNVEEAVAASREVGAKRTLLTHLTHRVSHAELTERLPPGVEAAYDGLTLELEG